MLGHHFGLGQLANIDIIRDRGHEGRAHQQHRTQRGVQPRIQKCRIDVREKVRRRRHGMGRRFISFRIRQSGYRAPPVRLGPVALHRRLHRDGIEAGNHHLVRQRNRRRDGEQTCRSRHEKITDAVLFGFGPGRVFVNRDRQHVDDLVRASRVLYRNRCDQ